jgi:hypothetical protein
MNIIELNENVINNYAKYVTSYVEIDDVRIKEELKKKRRNTKLL